MFPRRKTQMTRNISFPKIASLSTPKRLTMLKLSGSNKIISLTLEERH